MLKRCFFLKKISVGNGQCFYFVSRLWRPILPLQGQQVRRERRHRNASHCLEVLYSYKQKLTFLCHFSLIAPYCASIGLACNTRQAGQMTQKRQPLVRSARQAAVSVSMLFLAYRSSLVPYRVTVGLAREGRHRNIIHWLEALNRQQLALPCRLQFIVPLILAIY